MNHYGGCQRPNVYCRLYVEKKNEMRFGSVTVRLRLDFVYLEASWSPSRLPPLFWSSVNWRWGALPLSGGSKLGVLAVGFSGPWENTSESVTIIPPGTKLAGHFWSSSDPRLEPCCSPFPALRSHWESMTSSSAEITHLRGSFKSNGWLCRVFKLCCGLDELCRN